MAIFTIRSLVPITRRVKAVRHKLFYIFPLILVHVHALNVELEKSLFFECDPVDDKVFTHVVWGTYRYGGFKSKRFVEASLKQIEITNWVVGELRNDVLFCLLNSRNNLSKKVRLNLRVLSHVVYQVSSWSLDRFHTSEEHRNHFIDDFIIVVVK